MSSTREVELVATKNGVASVSSVPGRTVKGRQQVALASILQNVLTGVLKPGSQPKPGKLHYQEEDRSHRRLSL